MQRAPVGRTRLNASMRSWGGSMRSLGGSMRSFGEYQTQEDLMELGLSAREAGQQAVRHNRVVGILMRVLAGLKMLLMLAAAVPCGLGLVCFFLASQGSGDMLRDLVSYLFSHLGDFCDQPLGTLLFYYWASLLIVMGALAFGTVADCLAQLQCCSGSRERACSLFMSSTRQCFTAVFMVPMSVLWLFWPFVTLHFALRAKKCSAHLKGQAWFLLVFYMLCFACFLAYTVWPMLKPVLYRYNLLPDPGSVAESFETVLFQQDRFRDDVEGCYPASCPICLDDFGSGQQIVISPCSGRRHVFHRDCLASWLRMTQTCPLCRSPLAPGGAGLELMRGQS